VRAQPCCVEKLWSSKWSIRARASRASGTCADKSAPPCCTRSATTSGLAKKNCGASDRVSLRTAKNPETAGPGVTAWWPCGRRELACHSSLVTAVTCPRSEVQNPKAEPGRADGKGGQAHARESMREVGRMQPLRARRISWRRQRPRQSGPIPRAYTSRTRQARQRRCSRTPCIQDDRQTGTE
jgi:hypothetical protein